MGGLTRSRPSPAIVVAVIALVAAIAGTAVAGPTAETSKITKKKVAKIAGEEIQKLAPTLSVANARTADSAGTATTAGSAGTATTADTATNADAVGGVKVDRVSFLAPDGTGPTQIYNRGSLVLTADCNPADDVEVSATTTVSNSILWSYGNDTATATGETDNVVDDTDFDVGETHDLVAEDDSNQVGELRYATKGGSVVTLAWTSEDDLGGSGSGGNECVFTGHAMQSG